MRLYCVTLPARWRCPDGDGHNSRSAAGGECPLTMVVMDRRLVGALLVAVVLAAAISVPAWGGLRITGRGVAIELPADPKVGDCIFDASAGVATAVLQQPRSSATADINFDQSLPGIPVVAGPCNDQPVIGEVVAMISQSGRAPGRSVPSGQDFAQRCRTAALEYAGLEQMDDRFTLTDQQVSDPVTWNLSIHTETSRLLPSPLLRSAGRAWSACVASAPGLNPHHGTLAAAYRGGELPNEFGTCWDSRDVTTAMRSVGCGDAHVAELVSMGTVHDRSATTPEAIRNSCSGLAARVIGRTDPTAGGRLVVQVSPDPGDTIRYTFPSLEIVCYVMPDDHSLSGSLVGLRDQPLPFTT